MGGFIMIAVTWVLFFAVPLIYKKLVWDADTPEDCKETKQEQKTRKRTNESDFETRVVTELRAKGCIVTVCSDNAGRKGFTLNVQESNRPMVYFDDLYTLYKQNGMRLDHLINEVLQLKRPSRKNDSFEPVRARNICFRLLNAENNRELLKNLPHEILYDDMALCLEVNYGNGIATLVSNSSFSPVMWKIVNNTAPITSPPTMFSPKDPETNLLAVPWLSDPYDAYKLTNTSGRYGASALFYDGVEKKIYNLLGEYYAIPASVHEWLIAPVLDGDDEEVRQWKELLTQANRKQQKSNVLSNNVYYYDGKKLLKL